MKMTDDELIDAVLEAADPVASTPEIADLDSVSISKRAVHKRLVSLAETGDLERKTVGRTTVWWVPGETGTVKAEDVYTEGGVAQRVDQLDERVGVLDDRLGELKNGIDRLGDTTDRLENTVDSLADQAAETQETVKEEVVVTEAYQKSVKELTIGVGVMGFALLGIVVYSIFPMPSILAQGFVVILFAGFAFSARPLYKVFNSN